MAKKAKDKQPDDDHCGAKTKAVRPCRHPKGFRTDHPGSGRCYRHGGASPNGNKAAVREQMASLATDVDVEPQEVLLSAIRRDWGAVQWCGNIIGQLEYTLAQARESGDMKSVVVLEKRLLGFQAVYGEWIDRSAKHAKLALDAGVEERKVRIADQQRRAHRPGHPLSPRRPRAEQEAADRRSGDCAPPSAGAGRVTLTRLILSWALLVSASLGMAWSWYLRRRNCISEKSMVGLTLLLSWLALVYSAVTTIFVS